MLWPPAEPSKLSRPAGTAPEDAENEVYVSTRNSNIPLLGVRTLAAWTTRK